MWTNVNKCFNFPNFYSFDQNLSNTNGASWDMGGVVCHKVLVVVTDTRRQSTLFRFPHSLVLSCFVSFWFCVAFCVSLNVQACVKAQGWESRWCFNSACIDNVSKKHFLRPCWRSRFTIRPRRRPRIRPILFYSEENLKHAILLWIYKPQGYAIVKQEKDAKFRIIRFYYISVKLYSIQYEEIKM